MILISCEYLFVMIIKLNLSKVITKWFSSNVMWKVIIVPKIIKKYGYSLFINIHYRVFRHIDEIYHCILFLRVARRKKPTSENAKKRPMWQ